MPRAHARCPPPNGRAKVPHFCSKFCTKIILLYYLLLNSCEKLKPNFAPPNGRAKVVQILLQILCRFYYRFCADLEEVWYQIDRFLFVFVEHFCVDLSGFDFGMSE